MPVGVPSNVARGSASGLVDMFPSSIGANGFYDTHGNAKRNGNRFASLTVSPSSFDFSRLLIGNLGGIPIFALLASHSAFRQSAINLIRNHDMRPRFTVNNSGNCGRGYFILVGNLIVVLAIGGFYKNRINVFLIEFCGVASSLAAFVAFHSKRTHTARLFAVLPASPRYGKTLSGFICSWTTRRIISVGLNIKAMGSLTAFRPSKPRLFMIRQKVGIANVFDNGKAKIILTVFRPCALKVLIGVQSSPQLHSMPYPSFVDMAGASDINAISGQLPYLVNTANDVMGSVSHFAPKYKNPANLLFHCLGEYREVGRVNANSMGSDRSRKILYSPKQHHYSIGARQEWVFGTAEEAGIAEAA